MFDKFFPLNIPAQGIKQNHKNIVYADSQNKNMDAMIYNLCQHDEGNRLHFHQFIRLAVF